MCACVCCALQRLSETRSAVALSSPDTPDPVRVMACKAIDQFCSPMATHRKADVAAVRELLPTIITGTAALLSGATEDSLALLIDALTAVARVDGDVARSVAEQVVPHVLAVWSKHSNDMLLVSSVRDCVRAFAAAPGCAPLLAHMLEQPLLTLLRTPLAADEPTAVQFLRTSLLELLAGTVNGFAAPQSDADASTRLGAPSMLVDRVLPSLVAVTLSADDAQHSLLQNAAVALTAFARRVDPAAGVDGNAVAESLLQCVARLLAPTLDDQAALFVGPLVSALLNGALRPHVEAHLEQLLRAVYDRLGHAKMPSLVKDLVMVFVRLFRHNAEAVASWLHGVPGDGRAPVPGTPASANGLHYVLGMWCKWHEELVGAFATKLSAAVLVQVAGTALGDVEVPGALVIEERPQGAVRRSARQAARQSGTNAAPSERWTSVPLRLKVITLMAANYRDALLESVRGTHVPAAVADEFEDDPYDDDDDDALAHVLQAGGVDDDGGDNEYYKLISHYADSDDDEDDEREEMDDPDIVADELYGVRFAALIEQYFAHLAREAPQLLDEARNAGLLNKKHMKSVEEAVRANQEQQ